MCRSCLDSGVARHQTRYGLIVSTLLGLLLSGCGSAPTESEPALPAQSAKQSAKPGSPEEAAALTAAAEPVLPPEAVQQFDRAVTLMSSGDLAQAEQGFRSLATAYPSYSGPLLNLGILHAKAGKLDEAEKAIREAIARNANNAAAFNQLGIVYRKLGRFKEADEAYTRAVQIDPNYALAYLNLGVLCDLYLQEPQRALEAYERYLQLAATPDAKVTGWVTELKKRIGAEPRSAQTAG
ncbi:tetratricopeptide repeat protein [Steroidobacter sp.]|uniref:tetratricopeptide repeat protein n=1 Tax=Steroidobacter sp. TaxID=1978227 RepID=UPI001A579EBA|nr:tetratricopeptide repeat protein [Steroidobacter sp.]MBL8269187.1 tetratricopeptide repeat protein [Steroidobacter sp.]